VIALQASTLCAIFCASKRSREYLTPAEAEKLLHIIVVQTIILAVEDEVPGHLNFCVGCGETLSYGSTGGWVTRHAPCKDRDLHYLEIVSLR
jgi:hypothetical protein